MIKYSLALAIKQELRFLSDLIADIRAQVPKIDILLVGAMARDLLLFHAHGIKATRGTDDIDLGFTVASWSDYGKLRDSLLSSDSFHSHPSGAHKLLYHQRLVVDLIPFGGLENPAGPFRGRLKVTQ
jgi:predicted nucleotidyltransferase